MRIFSSRYPSPELMDCSKSRTLSDGHCIIGLCPLYKDLKAQGHWCPLFLIIFASDALQLVFSQAPMFQPMGLPLR